ncbi:Peptidase family M28 [Caloramator quimbayensis]|uniref:Peptidase family M28 n=1 Tax=Caloramator quimbayensis TaxID=1147123 RepID=A0A1T4WDR3_9CLOT|nr:M28 family metallopeptidase [Caloramator quimbayensis]SKA75466.1 Peptidase family M28 [Caloramator quimbayensis]
MKIKKTIYFIIIFLIFTSAAAYPQDFNTENIKNTIKILSSDKYRGRLAGDKGNALAAEYISSYFKSLGLKEGGDNNTFYQKFEIIVPFITGDCRLKVIDKSGKTVKEYEYGKDFKELIYGASVKGEVVGKIKSDNNEGTIEIIEGGFGENSLEYSQDLILKKSGIKAVLYTTNMNFRFRSPYKLQKTYDDGIVKLMISKNILNEILKYSSLGYSFYIKSPVEVKKVYASNVIGILEGSDKNLPPVILSAHFDHVGFDADGKIYPGALDNASGTALLLECARVLKSSNQKRTIIFAAFNGEEEGLIGSKYFTENPPIDIKGAECINFDMVGSIDKAPLSILSLESRAEFSSQLFKIISPKVSTKLMYDDNSDHAPLCRAGIDAVTLIHDNITKIHTPNDTLENVDVKRIKEVYTAAEAFLKYRDIVMVSSQFNNKHHIPVEAFIFSAIILISAGIRAALYLKKKCHPVDK